MANSNTNHYSKIPNQRVNIPSLMDENIFSQMNQQMGSSAQMNSLNQANVFSIDFYQQEVLQKKKHFHTQTFPFLDNTSSLKSAGHKHSQSNFDVNHNSNSSTTSAISRLSQESWLGSISPLTQRTPFQFEPPSHYRSLGRQQKESISAWLEYLGFISANERNLISHYPDTLINVFSALTAHYKDCLHRIKTLEDFQLHMPSLVRNIQRLRKSFCEYLPATQRQPPLLSYHFPAT